MATTKAYSTLQRAKTNPSRRHPPTRCATRPLIGAQKSPLNSLRKAYLKLSMIIHPDKLTQYKFEDATKAFQALVGAFESLTRPDVPVDGGVDSKAKKISRSNAGCVVTTVKCPRCKVAWGAKTDGNPDYFYNFMMTGLKSYTCSTCLFEFGCMAAIHCCVFCKHEFEYSPGDPNPSPLETSAKRRGGKTLICICSLQRTLRPLLLLCLTLALYIYARC